MVMPLSTLRAIANMRPVGAQLTNKEKPHDPANSVREFSVARCDWAVPWCVSTEAFNDGHYLKLVFSHPQRGNAVSLYIWQEKRREPETDGGIYDRVRYTWSEQYASAPPAVGILGADRDGTPNRVDSERDRDYVPPLMSAAGS
jgi:hypothetical protein